MSAALYRVGLIAASLGGAMLSIAGAALLSRGEAPTVGHALVYSGLALACTAAGASVIDTRAR